MYWLVFLFFFSSRRRHTRCLSDWSSDVCSSDLESVGRGRLSRSSRKSVRRASTGSGVNAAKKRESVERAGNWSRSRPGHERTGKRLEPFVEGLQGMFHAHGVAEEHGEKIDHRVRARTAAL